MKKEPKKEHLDDLLQKDIKEQFIAKL